MSEKIEYIPKEKLVIADYNPRINRDPTRIRELAENIKNSGISIPLLVRKNDNIYEIYDGGDRFLAGLQSGLEKFPCIVKEISLEDAKKDALQVNVVRNDLTNEEIALYVKRLLKENIFKTKKEVAIFLGKSEKWVNNILNTIEKITDEVEARELRTKYPSLDLQTAKTLVTHDIKSTPEEIAIISNMQKDERKKVIEIATEKNIPILQAIKTLQKEREKTAQPKTVTAPSGYKYQYYITDDAKIVINKIEKDTPVQTFSFPKTDLKKIIQVLEDLQYE